MITDMILIIAFFCSLAMIMNLVYMKGKNNGMKEASERFKTRYERIKRLTSND